MSIKIQQITWTGLQMASGMVLEEHWEITVGVQISRVFLEGRDIGKEYVEKFYAKNAPSGTYKGCSSYEDYRELLAKEKDIDAIKIMTPDHTHAQIAIDSLNAGKHVITHKPIANRMKEARKVIDLAKRKRTGHPSAGLE